MPREIFRIVLVGFMGAGKSTAGPLLAERLGWEFMDADQCLARRTGQTIAELFEGQGEAGFREMEATIIAELHERQEVVLALGGGAIETDSTRRLLSESTGTCVVFLNAPLAVLIERCESQPGAAVRPILQQRETLSERFHSRLQHYERAHVTIDTHGLSPETVADRIMDRLRDGPFHLSSLAGHSSGKR
ncbi:Shikimate kinase I [Acidisarcina polymorpha]|uniref:Shikimate kinase n=1 Tax=Acidisarcina polymorpha TaxID=2211140 RepID=A0A2Z5G7F6_9BACT|nr:shikimate kinase [Acidisarcina polymorpha]AXC15193.1 Shikimate kinase I [Acidisarcina polymorpha]